MERKQVKGTCRVVCRVVSCLPGFFLPAAGRCVFQFAFWIDAPVELSGMFVVRWLELEKEKLPLNSRRALVCVRFKLICVGNAFIFGTLLFGKMRQKKKSRKHWLRVTARKRTTFPFRPQNKRSSTVQKLQKHDFPWVALWRFPPDDVSSRETTRPEPELKKAPLPIDRWRIKNSNAAQTGDAAEVCYF